MNFSHEQLPAPDLTSPITFQEINEALYSTIELGIAGGKTQPITLTNRDYNKGVFLTQRLLVSEDDFRSLNEKITVILTKRKSKKNPNITKFELIIVSGHGQMVQKLQNGEPINAVITQVYDRTIETSSLLTHKPRPYPFNIFVQHYKLALGRMD